MEKTLTITTSDGYRLFRDVQADILPSVGALINQLILEGRTEEEIKAAVRTAVIGYREVVITFIGQA